MKKVTVITPYYRGEKTIFNTINSVFNSYENVKDEINLEYIVIIDSMEDKDKIFKKLKNEYKDKIILLENQENLGVAKSRNKAIKLATGDYVIFLDQDDNLDKNYFTYIKNNIEADSKVILVNGYICNKVNGKKAPLYYVRPKLRRKTFLRANKISTPGQVVFSKSIINNNFFTGCSEEFKGADDWAAYINMFLNNPNLKIDYISKKLFYYNLHGNNYSNNWAELNSSAIETSKYFINKVQSDEKKILQKRINILAFENMYLGNKSLDFKLKNLCKIIDYYIFHIVYVNRILGAFHKKLIGFYR